MYMMKKLLAVAALCTAVTAGCGDDGSTDGGVDTGTGDTGMDATTDTGAGGNACVNATDPMAITNTHGEDNTAYSVLVTNCALGCFGMGDDCAVDCIVAATDNPTVSRPCASCSAQLSTCTAINCIPACPNPLSPDAACLACICEGAEPATENCAAQFEECAGLYPTDLCGEPSDGGTGDGGTDAAADGATDGGSDAAADGATDGGTDAAADGATDGGTDASADGATDGGSDAAADGGADASADVGT